MSSSRKTVIVTGASQGIGAGLVQAFRDRDYRVIAQAVFGAVTLLLVVACANVAAVMLARGIARRREMGIRLAIGAGRSRLLQQLLVESVLLSIAGGIFGLVLGRWALHLLIAALPDGTPPWVSLQIDWRTALYSVLLTLGAAVIFGWAPALHAVRGDLRHSPAQSMMLKYRTTAGMVRGSSPGWGPGLPMLVMGTPAT